ncbi:MAG TPA: coenzyme F420-0:L-glutamate ligase [Chloroflexota bacterium]|nr:coenzyme F420-0:L-glutamate ligase [Chloroflexota bacterium]
MTVAEVRLLPIRGMPEMAPGADLAGTLLDALERADARLEAGDVVVVTHKIVAKAEGALVDLRTVTPSALATRYAERWGKDARQLEVVLQQCTRIVRMDRGVLIAETRHGFICANAGVDLSNVAERDVVCLLPDDPDGSAARIRAGLIERRGVDLAVIISDTFGRPWREGLTNVAIGVAGMEPLRDYVGRRDPHGYELRVSALAIADEIASAAELVMGKLDRVPAAIVRGYAYDRGAGSARMLVRRPELDLFR